jgi:hypothetical protein
LRHEDAPYIEEVVMVLEQKIFTLKCDNKSPTLTIIKAQNSGFYFGGYTEAEWDSMIFGYKHKADPNAFLFSLTNKEAKPCKMNVIDPTRAICCDSYNGPIFGDDDNFNSADINKANNANTNEKGFKNLGLLENEVFLIQIQPNRINI